MKKILVAVLGNTPAILTEAIYYYAKRYPLHNEDPIVFDEVHVFTTTEGRTSIRDELFGGTPGETLIKFSAFHSSSR
jgi:CRISPR-associated protein (TIGR02584 family)